MTRETVDRRTMMKAASFGALAGAATSLPRVAAANANGGEAAAAPTGKTHRFEMTIEERAVRVARGLNARVWAYEGQVPGPLIRVREGDRVEATVTNNTRGQHTIHWHGVYQTGSWRSDGVPGITQTAIGSGGKTGTYSFLADKPGSLWYHCHVGVPNHVGIRGMWGPLIVDPAEPLPIEKEVTKDAILMFSSWNSSVAEDYFGAEDPTGKLDFFSINGKAFPDTQPIRVRKGDVLRLRLYAVSADVAFHLHGHDMMVTHQDGRALAEPQYADTVYVAMGQRKDVVVHMNNPGRWAAHDHQEHHISNGGSAPGGIFTVVEYEEVKDDPWYYWARKEFDPDFYFIESMQSGYGLIQQPQFRGEPLKGG